MMENESLREPKNSAVMFLSAVTAVVLIWAIAASVMASKRGKECERLTQERDQIRVELDQVRTDAQRVMMEADKLRRTALEWTRQHQMRVQEEMKKKAEAAKAAQTQKTTSKTTTKAATSKKR